MLDGPKAVRRVLANRRMAGQITNRVVPTPIQTGRRRVIECTYAWAVDWVLSGAGRSTA